MTNKYAYVTLLSNDGYLPGVVLLKATLDKTGSKYPLVCMLPNKLSDESMDILNKLNIQTIDIEKIFMPDNIYQHNRKINARQADIWIDTLSKFQAWTLEEYDKIMLIDCDLLILKNLDHLFEKEHMTAALDGEYFNLWPNFAHFNTGLVVIKPNKNDLLEFINFTKNLDPSTIKNESGEPYVIADQELLNLFYKDWINKKELHLNKYYDIFAPHMFKNHFEDVINNAYFVHYTGMKPWQVIQSGLSPLFEAEVKEYRDYMIYAYSAAIIELIYKNNFEYDDLDLSINSIDIQKQMAYLLIYRFDDVDAASTIISNIGDETDKKIINRFCLAKKLKPMIHDLAVDIYKQHAIDGSESLNIYSLLAVMEHSPVYQYAEPALGFLSNVIKA